MNWIIKTLIGYYLKKGATLDFLGGYKVYILCLGAIVVAVIGLLGGASFGVVTIPLLSSNETIDIIWKALVGITGRKAISKIEEKVNPAVLVTKFDLDNIKQIDRVNPNVRPPRQDDVGNPLVVG